MFLKSVYYDIDCINSFLIIDRVDLLKSAFSRIHVSNQTIEIYSNPSLSEELRDKFNELIYSGFVKKEEINLNTDIFALYHFLVDNKENGNKFIGKSEASTIALASNSNSVILSNNPENISAYLEKYDIKTLNSGDILIKLCQKKVIDKEEADIIWRLMSSKGVNLPEKTFKDYLDIK